MGSLETTANSQISGDTLGLPIVTMDRGRLRETLGVDSLEGSEGPREVETSLDPCYDRERSGTRS